MNYKLYIDDQLDDVEAPERHTPEGFIGVKSSQEAIELVKKNGLPSEMDLDHDLGEDDNVMIFLHWLSNEFPCGPVPDYKVHSANPVGSKNIISYLESWKKSLW